MGDEDDSAEVEEKEKRDFGETLRLNETHKTILLSLFQFVVKSRERMHLLAFLFHMRR